MKNLKSPPTKGSNVSPAPRRWASRRARSSTTPTSTRTLILPRIPRLYSLGHSWATGSSGMTPSSTPTRCTAAAPTTSSQVLHSRTATTPRDTRSSSGRSRRCSPWQTGTSRSRMTGIGNKKNVNGLMAGWQQKDDLGNGLVV